MLYPPPMGPPPTVQGLGSHDDKPYSRSNPTENGDKMRLNNTIRYGTRLEGLQACDPEYSTGHAGGKGGGGGAGEGGGGKGQNSTEEHTSELHSLMQS